MRHDLPSGTVTFLFTDVEGSTKLLHELGADAYIGQAGTLRESLGLKTRQIRAVSPRPSGSSRPGHAWR